MHELQAEPWGPVSIKEMDLAEQNNSMNAKMLRDRFVYIERSGIKDVYLWGAEYWYYRKVVLGEPSVWDEAITKLSKTGLKATK